MDIEGRGPSQRMLASQRGDSADIRKLPDDYKRHPDVCILVKLCISISIFILQIYFGC